MTNKISNYLTIAENIATAFYHKTHIGNHKDIGIDDLISAGREGIVKALSSQNVPNGESEKRYVITTIKNTILDEFLQIKYPGTKQKYKDNKIFNKIRKIKRTLEQELQRKVLDEEIIEQDTDMSKSDLEAYRNFLMMSEHTISFYDLDQKNSKKEELMRYQGGNEDSVTSKRIDLSNDPSDNSLTDRLFNDEAKKVHQNKFNINNLSEIEREVIKMLNDEQSIEEIEFRLDNNGFGKNINRYVDSIINKEKNIIELKKYYKKINMTSVGDLLFKVKSDGFDSDHTIYHTHDVHKIMGQQNLYMNHKNIIKLGEILGLKSLGQEILERVQLMGFKSTFDLLRLGCDHIDRNREKFLYSHRPYACNSQRSKYVSNLDIEKISQKIGLKSIEDEAIEILWLNQIDLNSDIKETLYKLNLLDNRTKNIFYYLIHNNIKYKNKNRIFTSGDIVILKDSLL